MDMSYDVKVARNKAKIARNKRQIAYNEAKIIVFCERDGKEYIPPPAPKKPPKTKEYPGRRHGELRPFNLNQLFNGLSESEEE